MDWKKKLASRKFWLCTAAFLASIGAGITGIAVGDTTMLKIGAVCTVFSAAIYAACEAWVDGKNVSSSTTSNARVENVTVSSNDKETAKEALTPSPEPDYVVGGTD